MDLAGDPGEGPGTGVDATCGPAAGDPPQELLGQGGAQQTAPQQHQQRGHQRQGRGDGDQDDRHARHADGPQDGGAHEHQAHQRRGHRQPGEQHGVARRGQRRRHALGDERVSPTGAPAPQAPVRRGLDLVIQAAGQLLAVAGGQQQPVVDGQAQADDRGDIDDEGLQVGDEAERVEHAQGAGDRGQRAEQGHAGQEEPAEDHHHDQQRQGQGDELPADQVPLDLVVDRLRHERLVGDHARRLGADVAQVVGDRPQPGLDLAHELGDLIGVGLVIGVGDLVPIGVDGHDHEEAVQVAGRQRLGRGLGEHAGDDEGVQDVLLAGQRPQVGVRPGERGGDLLLSVGAGDVDAGDQQAHGLRVAGQGVQDLLALGALSARDRRVARLEPVEQAGPAEAAQRDGEKYDGERRPCTDDVPGVLDDATGEPDEHDGIVADGSKLILRRAALRSAARPRPALGARVVLRAHARV